MVAWVKGLNGLNGAGGGRVPIASRGAIQLTDTVVSAGNLAAKV
jgi:hypothetical protein